jgi:diacylglycerol kinase family enzyme
MRRARWAAILALVFAAAAIGVLVYLLIADFPRSLYVVGLFALAALALSYAVFHRGVRRALGATVLVLAVAGAIAALVAQSHVLEAVELAGVVIGAGAATKAAFAVHTPLPFAPAPRRPVLLYNPKSGGGKATSAHLADEARARGIEPVELTHGADLGALARDAVARGADAIGMAGGDGSQAIVAALAAEYDLPYVCVPAGTRNHFALDLGVDRDDVVGALDAFAGGERRVDLAEVNGRVFVNNVSLGVYAEAVQREGYREAKLRTILDTIPDALDPEASETNMRWTGPGGHEHSGGVAILVSNNRYRLGRAIGSGTRPRIDDGLLGVTAVSTPALRGDGRIAQRPWREWSAREFVVEGDGPIAAGVDGEALMLKPPLRFAIRPLALRVRIAPAHPGASPSAAMPDGLPQGARALVRIAAGVRPEEAARPRRRQP